MQAGKAERCVAEMLKVGGRQEGMVVAGREKAAHPIEVRKRNRGIEGGR